MPYTETSTANAGNTANKAFSPMTGGDERSIVTTDVLHDPHENVAPSRSGNLLGMRRSAAVSILVNIVGIALAPVGIASVGIAARRQAPHGRILAYHPGRRTPASHATARPPLRHRVGSAPRIVLSRVFSAALHVTGGTVGAHPQHLDAERT